MINRRALQSTSLRKRAMRANSCFMRSTPLPAGVPVTKSTYWTRAGRTCLCQPACSSNSLFRATALQFNVDDFTSVSPSREYGRLANWSRLRSSSFSGFSSGKRRRILRSDLTSSCRIFFMRCIGHRYIGGEALEVVAVTGTCWQRCGEGVYIVSPAECISASGG